MLEKAASTNSEFQSKLEEWLMAVIQSSFARNDEQIINKVIESFRSGVASNVEYHDHLARVLSDSEPVIARQHRLLARIYSVLGSNPKSA